MCFKRVCILTLHLFWSCVAIPNGATGATIDEVAQAAARGLPEMLAKIPAGAWSDYGFADASEVAQAALDLPMALSTITPTALAHYKPGDPVGALLSDTTLWYVPIRVKESVRAVLVVDRMNGEWQVVSLGYAPLAAPLQALLAQWPASRGYHPQLIVVFQAQQYLFTVPELGADNLTRLSGVPGLELGLKAGPAKIGRVDETVLALQPIVSENLSGRE